MDSYQSMYKYMKVGVVHFMLYPQISNGEGPVLQALEEICADDFFTAIEITGIKDDQVREDAGKMLQSSHLAISYCAHPMILGDKLNLNSLDSGERKKAVDEIKKAVEEAACLGAESMVVLSGPHPGQAEESSAGEALIDSLLQLCECAEKYGLRLELELFDFDVDKKCLVGPSRTAAEIAKKVKETCANFGLLPDLSHLPLQHENTRDALIAAAAYITHLHIGNCVMKKKDHPAYGDQHPRFGIPGGENDIAEVSEFLKALLELKVLNPKDKPILSFEVKPAAGESPAIVIANAKRVLTQAWAEIG